MDSNKHKGYSEWMKAKPWDHDALNLLQLDHFDRSVIKVAGKFSSTITCTINLKFQNTKKFKQIYIKYKIYFNQMEIV